MLNVHERFITAPLEQAGALLDTVGSRGDRLWPLPPRTPMLLRHPGGNGLADGAAGGHGSIRYALEEHVPGRRVVFRFTPSLSLVGTHVFTTEPAPGGTVLRHELDVEPRGAMRVLLPLMVRSMHDCYVEDAFDRAERELGVGPAAEHRHSRWNRLLERRPTRHVRPTEPMLTGLGAGALDRVDAADAFTVDLLTGDGDDPLAWSRDFFTAAPRWVGALLRLRDALVRPFGLRTSDTRSPERPDAMFPVLAVSSTEALLGLDDAHLDFRVVTTVDEASAQVTLTTVVRVHSRLGRVYWGVVRHVHPLVVRAIMRQAAYPAGFLTGASASQLQR